MFERKIINDPVFGFINIPKGLLYDIVRHPLLQRLNRIKQLGLSSVVYPGAQHTRFQHSLGAFHLTSEAVQQLASKGNFIFDSEAEAVQAAILMHDIGHGPFSHVLEDTIVQGVSHEDISLMLMERINKEMNGQLTLAIQIFKDEYLNKCAPVDIPEAHYVQKQNGTICAAITASVNGVTDDHTAEGNGRLDAVANAIKQALNFDFTVETYTEHALERKSTSEAVSYVGISCGDKMYWGVGRHSDIIVSSIKGLVSAINNAFADKK